MIRALLLTATLIAALSAEQAVGSEPTHVVYVCVKHGIRDVRLAAAEDYPREAAECDRAWKIGWVRKATREERT